MTRSLEILSTEKGQGLKTYIITLALVYLVHNKIFKLSLFRFEEDGMEGGAVGHLKSTSVSLGIPMYTRDMG